MQGDQQLEKAKSAEDNPTPMTTTVPISIISHYAPYRNKVTKTKPCSIMGCKFELEDKYAVIDAGSFTFPPPTGLK